MNALSDEVIFALTSIALHVAILFHFLGYLQAFSMAKKYAGLTSPSGSAFKAPSLSVRILLHRIQQGYLDGESICRSDIVVNDIVRPRITESDGQES